MVRGIDSLGEGEGLHKMTVFYTSMTGSSVKGLGKKNPKNFLSSPKSLSVIASYEETQLFSWEISCDLLSCVPKAL